MRRDYPQRPGAGVYDDFPRLSWHVLDSRVGGLGKRMKKDLQHRQPGQNEIAETPPVSGFGPRPVHRRTENRLIGLEQAFELCDTIDTEAPLNVPGDDLGHLIPACIKDCTN